MGDLVPAGQRFDRAALERIVKRAAELQAGEREIGEGLTESEIIGLGQEVGIPEGYLKRALLEELTRPPIEESRGLMVRLAGARHVYAARTIAGDPHEVEQRLGHWMSEGELLAVKRRYPQQTSWEARQGAFASLRRSLNFGGRAYILARAREVVGQVVPLESGWSHVRLLADLGNTLTDRLGTAGGVLGLGSLSTVIALTLGVAIPVAVIPVPIAAGLAFSLARGRRRELERVQVALEHILDRLERGDIALPRRAAKSGNGPFTRIADEVRRAIEP